MDALNAGDHHLVTQLATVGDVVDAGSGTDTIVLTATSSALNAASNAQLVNVEAVSAAGAATDLASTGAGRSGWLRSSPVSSTATLAPSPRAFGHAAGDRVLVDTGDRRTRDAFRRYLTDFPRLQEAPPATLDLWERYLVYGIAFGIAERVLQGAQLHLAGVALGDHILLALDRRAQSGDDLEVPDQPGRDVKFRLEAHDVFRR